MLQKRPAARAIAIPIPQQLRHLLWWLVLTVVLLIGDWSLLSVVSNGRSVIGYWLLVTGYWLLVIGYGLLVMGYWLFVIGYLLLVICYWLFVIRSHNS
jgi:CHASE2 domain-containing sensor protein